MTSFNDMENITPSFSSGRRRKQAGIQAVRQHHAIADALLKEDWKVAAKELSVHLHTNHPVLQEINSSS